MRGTPRSLIFGVWGRLGTPRGELVGFWGRLWDLPGGMTRKNLIVVSPEDAIKNMETLKTYVPDWISDLIVFPQLGSA